MTLQGVLAFAVQMDASDLHLSEGEPVGYRVHGVIAKAGTRALSHEDLEAFARAIFAGRDDLYSAFLSRKDADFSFVAADGTPFRCNGYFKQGKMAFALRKIMREAKKVEDLGMPEGVARALAFRQGLFLVTGPTGSGKSTSMVALVDRINETRAEHIVTIEDPVEFLFTPKKSVFSQREVGRDTDGFAPALRAAMREDPNVVMVGEMRDRETVEAAVNLAETGHLVFSTLHTASSAQTVARLVQFFPPDLQHQARARIADALSGVLSQRLLPRADGKGRVACYELMYVTPAIRNMIRSGDLVQMNNAVATGAQEGMVTMRHWAKRLVGSEQVREQDAAALFAHETD